MSTLTAPFARIFRSEKRDEAKTSVTSVKKSGAKNDGLIARTRLGAWLNRPMTSFHLVVATAALLTTLGLIMVLSASGVESYYDDGSAWTIFGKQVLWVCVGLVGFYIALRTPVAVMRRYSFPVFVFTVILITLVLIPGIGTYSNGSRGGSSMPVCPCSPPSSPRSRSRFGERICWPHAAWSRPACERCWSRWYPRR
ncbi:cell cycle family protein [Mycobacteroides abscessus MAB_030201_1075]|uniref:Probable peptidoglycan glycosyltransferase FtsW n=1 Tax=Mycobacteroides abscessus MAB_030201_1075 TaxID=1335410 RepID=A0A829PP83_9MYCO|nr:cell cycle family protein [Mycobacteroides abscessus MAB_030201_1075]